MPWIILFFAGILEICWAVGLKFTEGFTNVRWSVFTVAAIVGSMLLLGHAVRTLPIGTAYAVWTGIGVVGTAILGMILFGEPRTATRLVFIGFIIIGILGLRVAGGGE